MHRRKGFELLDLRTQRGLGGVQLRGCGGKCTSIRNRKNALQKAKFQIVIDAHGASKGISQILASTTLLQFCPAFRKDKIMKRFCPNSQLFILLV
jgi:hypothetical protein